MITRFLFAGGVAACVVPLLTGGALAIDANRSASLLRTAPNTMQGAANSLNDPYYGTGTTAAPAIRARDLTSTQPSWNDSAAPFVDPLRSNQSFGIGPNVVDPTPTLQRWRLGIYPEDTDTGVRISQVVAGSAAERAGLETNDRIVAVSGYQVGYVDGVLYDCGQEFERHADQSGWVRVLVQNNRDGRLLNMPIQLDPRHEAITGSASFRDRVSLPRDATLTVELREVYRTSLQPVTVAQQTFEARQSPIPFNLEFDPAQVDSRRQYVLYASIRGQGRQLYALRQEVPVLGGSGSTGLQLVLDSTQSLPGSTTSPNDQLAQITQWFRDYLGREPRSQELYVWESHLARGGTLEDAQLQILSTPEFYYQANADDTEYVRRMFLLVANRQPSAQEVDQWLRRLQYHNRMRSEMAREFLQTAAGQNSAVRRR